MRFRRLIFAAVTLIVILLGLASRRYQERLPNFVALYAGDTLWAIMVFCGLTTIAPAWSIRQRGLAALAFAFAIEISQLYHAPWIDSVRATRLGGLVLGFGFLWSDLVCYSAGICLAVVCEFAVSRKPAKHA